MIVVRRFSSTTRPWMRLHVSPAAITVNVALSDDDTYETRPRRTHAPRHVGGQMLGLYDGAIRAIKRRAGDATVYSASLLNGVSRIVQGERHSLIIHFA